MKGAIAEPLVSTSRPPKISIMIRIGSSQYFLRARRKAQNSFRNEVIDRSFSELLCHGFRRWTGRLAQHPVALGGGILAPAHRILAGRTHQKSDRKHRGAEHQAETE